MSAGRVTAAVRPSRRDAVTGARAPRRLCGAPLRRPRRARAAAGRASSTCSPRRAVGRRSGERPFLPRAFSVLRRHRTPATVELQFLVEDVGPGTKRLCELARRATSCCWSGRSAVGFGPPGDGRRRCWSAAGSGSRRWRSAGRARPATRRRCSASATPRTRRGRPAARGASSPPTTAASATMAWSPSCSTTGSTPASRRRGLCLRAAGDARGRPRDLRARAVSGAARTRVRNGVRVRRLLRLRGADPRRPDPRCASRARCSTPRVLETAVVAGAGHVTGPASIDFCGIELAHPIINASGTFDAIAARRAFGDELIERFPFAAFVSKTVTLQPREGNPPPRLWELAGGHDELDRPPQQGPAMGPRPTTCPSSRALPVPLIVNVMGFSRDEVAELVAAFARARRGRGARAQRLLPERRDRAGDGRRPARGGARCSSGSGR